MVYKVVRSHESDQDLSLIFRHFVDSYMSLGELLPDAFRQATRRITAIEADMEGLAAMPHQGTLDPRIMPGLRHVTKNRAVIYFHVDDVASVVRIIAVFFGGQEHQNRMAKRMSR
jgi:toxin ParE1/3/4